MSFHQSAQSVNAQSGRLIRGFIDNVIPLREGILLLIVLDEVKGNQGVIIVLPLIGSAMEVATHPADISVSRNKNQAEAVVLIFGARLNKIDRVTNIQGIPLLLLNILNDTWLFPRFI